MQNRCLCWLTVLLMSLALVVFSSVAAAVAKNNQKEQAKALDQKHPDYIRAVLIAKIMPYIYWQSSTFASSKSPYNLCIIESDKDSIAAIWPYLNLLSERESIGRSFELKEIGEFSENPNQVPSDCHILYFAELNQKHAKALVKLAANTPVLTIADSMEELSDGAMLAFIEERGRMKIYVNTEAITNSSLKIKSSLLRIAKKI